MIEMERRRDGVGKKKKKNSRAAPGGDSRCKKGWQNVEQIFMDHERKSEKKITNKKKKHTGPRSNNWN